MGRESFEKREREKKRQQRSAAKRERRETRSKTDTAASPVDSTELMERFRVLSEQFAAGGIAPERYEDQRREIFRALGLEPTSEQDGGDR